MTIFLIIMFSFIVISTLALIYIGICMNRNNKVFELRNHILFNFPIEKYHQLPEYNYMVYNFCVPLDKEYWSKKLGGKR